MKLPSGREVELKAFTYGDILDAEDLQFTSGKRGLNLYWLALERVATGLSEAEIRAMSPQDGDALFAAVKGMREGRPVEAEAPFETSSSSPSATTQA